MGDESTGAPLEPECRPPTLADLTGLCRHLNEQEARYLVIGGFAMVRKGFVRTTKDIDLLIDPSPENVTRVKAALMSLPDGAVREVRDTDVSEYNVVRVGDEIMVVLLGKACGITYEEVVDDIDWQAIDGVNIPFAGYQTLYRTKRTYRESDAMDRMFLIRAMEERGIPLPDEN